MQRQPLLICIRYQANTFYIRGRQQGETGARLKELLYAKLLEKEELGSVSDPSELRIILAGKILRDDDVYSVNDFSSVCLLHALPMSAYHKETIAYNQTLKLLYLIRAFENTTLLSVFPNELMAEILKHLHPGKFRRSPEKFNIKIKISPYDLPLSDMLMLQYSVDPEDYYPKKQPVEVTLPAHYYAVTTQTIMTREGKTQFSTEELRQIFGSSTHCFLYTTAAQARRKRLECTKKVMFWRTTTPLEFMITTAPIAEFTEGMQLERSRMTTVVYLHGHAPEQIELLQSCEHEQQLKLVVADVYDEYDRVSSSTTSTSSSDTGYSISSTSQLEPRHTTDGVTRALAFKESLEGLEYVELIEKMKTYAAGRFNGGFDPGKSFKAILYDKLIQHYGTQAQRDRLPTVVINREVLLAAITEAEKQIKQKVFQDLPLQAHQGAPRQDLVQLTRPGIHPAK